MRPTREATSGEDPPQANRANQMEPPTTTGPAPSSDEETQHPGR